MAACFQIGKIMLNYDYVPINKRRPLKFPNGKRVALIISFNLETWDMTKDTEEPYYAGGPAVLPNILPGNVADFPNYTWRESVSYTHLTLPTTPYV